MLEILVHNAASQILKHNNKIQRTPPAPLISIVGHFNMELLTANTGEFFSLHWQSQKLGDPPAWKKWEPFLFGSVPNRELGGCYALFAGDKLIYVGLGVSRGGGIYPECGISRRLMSHVYCSAPERGSGWSRLRKKWTHVSEIRTIGFSSATVYLAPALENYLIRAIPELSNARV